VATGTNPTSLNVDISGKFLYCTNSGSNNVLIYKIGTNGTLTPAGTANTGTTPTSIITVGTIQ
jgi:6-phosphogluconolactonase (cycloisomerase 2 family)